MPMPAFHGRAAYDWAVETSIYIDGSCRGWGWGACCTTLCRRRCRHRAFSTWKPASPAPTGADDEHLTRNSIQFHTHLGYRPVGECVQCGYKFGRWYNMPMWMEKHIGAHARRHPPLCRSARNAAHATRHSVSDFCTDRKKLVLPDGRGAFLSIGKTGKIFRPLPLFSGFQGRIRQSSHFMRY